MGEDKSEGHNGIKLEAASTRRRKKCDNGLLSRFSKWDRYKESSKASRTGKAEGAEVFRRRSSVRRTDFTNRKEYDRYQKQSRFIFHRGFFRRNGHNRSIKRGNGNRIRLRNGAELNAALQYVDLASMKPQEVLPPGREMVTFLPMQLRQRMPAVVMSSILPINDYTRSIKRSIPARPVPSKDGGTPRGGSRPNSTLHRSLSTPASSRSIRRKLHSPRRVMLQNMWRKYLFLVIFQRLQLRISLLSGNTDDSAATPGDAKGRTAEDSPPASLVNARRKVQ